MDKIECAVIGAGVIGLAVARALSLADVETIILEKQTSFGLGASSRNSGVIHAGIYYPAGSLKARFCVSGRQMLYDYCAAHHVAHRQCGKLIVATELEQMHKLEAIKAAALRNGVDDLQGLSTAEAQRLEPHLRCVGALASPSTGIVDAHGLMLSLLGDAQAHKATIAYGEAVTSMRAERDGILLFMGRDAEPALKARIVINAAGLGAPALTQQTAGLEPSRQTRPFLAKGSYFSLLGRAPFSRLIYPMPEPGGLGVHLTLDLNGQARFGPDVEWIERENYDVDPARANSFYAAIRNYWPDLPDGALVPAYAGIRAKIVGPGQANADFEIQGFETHGVPGLFNLRGIESPGLTSALAIADYVRDSALSSLNS